MKQFGFTYDTDIRDIKKFRGTFEIEKALNEKLKITDYTDKIQKIVFVYIAVNIEKFNPTDNFVKYRTKKKVIELGVNLPYKEFLAADKETELKLLKKAYIEGIEKLLSKRKDIDTEKLAQNVRELFGISEKIKA